ncbi:MAG: hybrid sensor histidine kinase/response regulator [Anaerolineae bacterium]|nr:hybrid sensor histidine kinase/response regulator [Anaerolineae bacterium]
MTSATQEVASAPGWSIELEDRIKDLRAGALAVCLVAVAVLGLLLLRAPASLLSVERSLVGTFLVLFLVGVTFWLRGWSYLPAAWLLFLGCVAMLGLVLAWTRYPPLVCLLVLPVAAGTILISIPAGLATSSVFTAVLLIWPGLFPGMDEGLTAITIAGIWIVEGALLMTLKPLVDTVQWAWRGYERSLESLEQARDYQQQLFETLDDLTEANVQLTRLNRLAQALRQAADNERRTKEQFVANVSHELRTPLNMIVGFCEMMVENPLSYGDSSLPPTLLADLDVVLRNSQHLSDLVDDVLDLSQIEAGQMALVREHVAFEEIMTSAVTAVSPLFKSKSLTLDVEIEADLPSVFCDRIRIREVMLNLLSNAGRFTEIGGVTVKAWREQDDLVVSVTDSGPGIPEGKRERLFRPFEQLDGTIRRRYGGTGLGLSISKSFVELHEGKVWVESQEGQGTTFFFRLPFTAPAPLGDSYMRWVDPYNPYEPRSRPSRLPHVQIQPRWVVVEQGTSMQRILARHLEGIDFVPVTSLPAAMDALRETPSQALLINELDVGAALAKLQDALSPPYSIPVIICSVPGVEQAINGLGVSGYLVKPIAREALLSALSHLAGPVETVMIVDDEREALMLYRRMLSSADRPYHVLRARNGRQAIEILQQQLPDVILLDLMMPEMDGFEFLRLRTGTAWEDVPVILISARDPLGHPIVSDALAVTLAGGLSVNQILTSIRMFTSMLAPDSHMSAGEDGAPTLQPCGTDVV